MNDVTHQSEQPEVHVLLHNIRSSHNVGSIFRTADAINIREILISGYTPRPIDRFGRPVKEIEKTALGAEKSIKWSSYETWEEAVAIARANGFTIIGLEQDDRAVDYKTFVTPQKLLFVLGEEVNGIEVELRSACDGFVEIPMHGAKESLNVSVAFGVSIYRMLDL